MERKERLLAVKDLIDQYKESEYGFDKLYEKLLLEYSLEATRDPDFKSNHYLNNLRQTRDKQADEYIRAKRKNSRKGSYGEYKAFVSHFSQDIDEALGEM